jgi:hypothetical protein
VILPLRHDALKAELAGVLEHERPVLLVQVLVEAYAGLRRPQYALRRGLPHGQRIASSGHFAFAKIRT